MKKRLLAALAMILGLSAAARAEEEPPPPAATPAVPFEASSPPRHLGAAGDFGARGQFVIGVDVPYQNEAPQVAFIRSSVSTGGSTHTTIEVRPSVDYFVAPHVSVGGLVGYSRGDVAFGGAGVASERSVTELSIGVRAGYDVRMTDLVSIWGRIEVIYAHISGAGSGYDVPLIVNVPVLLHPASHFFLGAGPTFSRDLAANLGGVSIAKTTNYGLQGIIGGYFGD